MAGSYFHIIDQNGEFTMNSIENLGDAHEALEECFVLIYELSNGDPTCISEVCKKYSFPDPWDKKDTNNLPQAPNLKGIFLEE